MIFICSSYKPMFRNWDNDLFSIYTHAAGFVFSSHYLSFPHIHMHLWFHLPVNFIFICILLILMLKETFCEGNTFKIFKYNEKPKTVQTEIITSLTAFIQRCDFF